MAGSTARYKPFGDYRTTPTNDDTDMGFTGHKENRDIGLTYMNARFYVPSVGKFASADTIIPDPSNPQSFNRYSYVFNSPLIFNDPSGHIPCDSVNLPGMDQAACDHDVDKFGTDDPTTPGAEGFDTYYPQAHYVAEQIIRAFPRDDQPMAFTRTIYGQQIGVWEGFFRTVLEPLDWMLLLKEYQQGELSTEQFLFNVVLAAAATSTADEATGLARIIGDCANSFSAETLVETDDGPIPISEIEIGDLVLAYDEVTGEVKYYPVTDLISHVDLRVVYLTIDGETLVTTTEHPFYSAENEWINAGDLQIGDDIRMAGWTTGEVEAVAFVTQPQPMYNFTVATAHTYFVGQGQWLVHNSFKCRLDKIDMVHIMNNHSDEGMGVVVSGSKKDVFTGLNLEQIEHRIIGAWNNDDALQLVQTQVGLDGIKRQRYVGVDPNSNQIVHMWFNVNTRTIETAFPKGFAP